MEIETLDQQVEQFQSWRNNLSRSLKQMRLWLRRNQMFTTEADSRINQVLAALAEDYLTVAFAGEFSRGKTELINALFFSDYGQRVLPSDAGRTTMCPTELYFDQKNKDSYLRLLPIETRRQQSTLNDLKESSELWTEIPLITNSAEALTRAFSVITDTIYVSPKEAEQLGFSKQLLGEKDDDGRVEIPRWRHALISFPHPILKKGLKIIDTPGLNALGSESELTLNLLPNAQAVIFLLSADAGVTASDLAVWDEFVRPIQNQAHVGLFAILNKIDVLWDELTDQHHFDASLNKVIKLTARQLNIPQENIIPLSARKGLVARVHRDAALLNDSRLEDLETILSHTLLENKQSHYWKQLLTDAIALINSAKSNLMQRRQQLQQQYQQVETLEQQGSENIEELLGAVATERKNLKSHIQTLEPSQRLLDRQTRELIDSLGPRQLERLMIVSRQQLIEANTTSSLFKAMKQFRINVIAMFDEFCREAELANKMAEAVYQKYEKTHGIEFVAPRLLEAKLARKELHRILNQEEKISKRLSAILTEQSSLVRKFFNTRVSQIAIFLNQNRKNVTEWGLSLMYPLEQQVLSRRRLLDEHFEQLQSIRRQQATTGGRLKALTTLMTEIEDELQTADNTLKTLQTRPQQFKSNVVKMAKAGN